MSQEHDDELAEAFFGASRGPKAAGGFKPEPESITEGFINPRSIIHLFCRGCGTVGELTEKGLRIYLDYEKKPFPEKIEPGMYLASDGCPSCTCIDGNFEIRRI
jgi:hypothetical protein